MMESYKINFIANSNCLELCVSGNDEEEILRNKCIMLLPFVVNYDETTDIAEIRNYFKNTDALKEKVKYVVEQLKDLNPKIYRMYDYFDKELKHDEWFYLCVDEELTQKDVDEIQLYLMSIDATKEERKFIAGSGEILQKLRDAYDIHIYNEKTKGYIGEPDKKRRLCRYCHKSMPDVTFKRVAHTISEALGNKAIKTNDECDDCNQHFGDTIEQDFLSIFDIPRLFFKIKGKEGVPHKFTGSNYTIENTADGQLKISYVMQDSEKGVEPEDLMKKLKLFPHREFPEQNIYKCLTKYAMGVLDDETLKCFDRARRWIMNEQEETNIPMLARLYRPMPVGHPRLIVFIRKPTAGKDLPHVVAELTIMNLTFVYILPFSNQDETDFTDKANFEKFWNFFDVYNKIDGWLFSECKSHDPRKPTIVLKFKQNDVDDSKDIALAEAPITIDGDICPLDN